MGKMAAVRVQLGKLKLSHPDARPLGFAAMLAEISEQSRET